MKNLFVALCLATSALAVPVAHPTYHVYRGEAPPADQDYTYIASRLEWEPTKREASEVDDAWSYSNDRFAWAHMKREAGLGRMPTNMNLPAEHVPATEEVHKEATPHADVPTDN